MPRRSRLGDFLAALVLLGGCAAVTGSRAADAPRPGPVRDLYYGEVLYHFYQRDDFTALTHLLVARDRGRVPHHEDQSEVLLGGLYLAYGQHERAGEIFERLLARNGDPAMRDRAWFYLGKVRYQRGLYPQALEAFASVKNDLPPALASELPLLVAESQMALGRFDAAAESLARVRGDDAWTAYARYNLGVALVRLNRVEEGARLLEAVGQMPAATAEEKGLRDKANVALGYAWLQVNDGTRARPVLERVRLHGPSSTKALLGVGWARALGGDYEGALSPWLELTNRDLLDSAVQESFLAVPYAFSRLQADGSAVARYETALATFDREVQGLDAAMGRARSGDLVRTLLAGDEDDLGRWYWQLNRIPDNEDSRYLYLLIADNDFHEGLKNYRDLDALSRHLGEWHDKLGAYREMVDTRRQAYRERLPEAEQAIAGSHIGALRARREEFARQIDEAASGADPTALATAAERDPWQRLAALEANPALPSPGNEELRERVRLLKGVLLWDLDRDRKLRLWHARRSLRDLDTALVQAEAALAAVREARDHEPRRLDQFARRIEAVSPRIDALQARVAAVLGRQQEYLVARAATELGNQKERLATYRVQARFALANLYDRVGVRQAQAEPPRGVP